MNKLLVILMTFVFSSVYAYAQVAPLTNKEVYNVEKKEAVMQYKADKKACAKEDSKTSTKAAKAICTKEAKNKFDKAKVAASDKYKAALVVTKK